MNTEKEINKHFIDNQKYPIWYYKKLELVDIDYVIQFLLKRTFVVEIQGIKHEIVFGKFKNGKIGQSITFNDIKSSNMCSYEVINKGFKEGKWFIITEEDTTDEFKVDYENRKKEYTLKYNTNVYKSILRNSILQINELSEEEKNKYITEIEKSNIKELETLFKKLFN